MFFKQFHFPRGKMEGNQNTPSQKKEKSKLAIIQIYLRTGAGNAGTMGL